MSIARRFHTINGIQNKEIDKFISHLKTKNISLYLIATCYLLLATCYFLILNSYTTLYFYCFDINRTINIYQAQHKSQSGDVIFYNNKYYLNLGEYISWPEQGAMTIHFDQERILPKICNLQTLELLHWMVNEWFSSYNKCIPLFFGNDINLLLKHKVASKKQQGKNQELGTKNQELIIFPSVFALTQYYQQYNPPYTNILTGKSTAVARSKTYRSINKNEIQTLYATHSQIFQNRYNLTSITIIDQYSSLYQTYQDPRYNLCTVIDKMKEIYTIAK